MRKIIKSKLLIIFMLAFISIGFIGCGSKDTPTATSPETTTTSITYVGSANSDKYHIPSCTSAQRIKASNLVEFTSKEDAESKGYQPCKVCKP